MTPPPLAFEGDVIVVTGASNGLGRAHAVALAALGARVVVNGRSESVHEVVSEIRDTGGVAASSQRDVRDGRAIIEDALHLFGCVDGLVLNAGVVCDRSFARMTDEEWQHVLDVNLGGARSCLAAVWPHLLERSYGRVVITISSAGFHGNPGQANYAASKGGLIGMGKALAIEGRRRGVLVNMLAPVAVTPMTSDVFPFDDTVLDRITPEQVSPVVVAMCHRTWSHTGQIVEAGGGWFSLMRWQRSHGLRLDPDDRTADVLLARWPDVSSFDDGWDAPSSSWDAVSAAIGSDETPTAIDPTS